MVSVFSGLYINSVAEKHYMKIEFKSPDELIPYVNNAKIHEPEQIELLAASIKEFGFNNPVLLDGDNGIIAGHGRLKAAKRLGLKEVPTIELSHLNPHQKRAYILADNRTAEIGASWDMSLVELEIQDLELDDFDIDDLGFEIDTNEEENEGLTNPDEAPEVDETREPISQRGMVWLCGEHRVMCGDSTSKEDVAKLMDGNKADFCVTSPPYNADAKFGTFANSNMGELYSGGYGDNLDSGSYIDFASSVLGICIENCKQFVAWNVNYNTNSRFEYIAQIAPFLENLREQVCWKKTSVIPYHAGLRRIWEPVYIFSCNGEGFGVDGEVQDNLIEIQNSGIQNDGHRGCFPVGLPNKIIEMSGRTGSMFEPFLGSGTSMISSETRGEKSYGMELDPKYCDLSVKRWQDFTGKQATLEGDNRTFNDIAEIMEKASVSE